MPDLPIGARYKKVFIADRVGACTRVQKQTLCGISCLPTVDYKDFAVLSDGWLGKYIYNCVSCLRFLLDAGEAICIDLWYMFNFIAFIAPVFGKSTLFSMLFSASVTLFSLLSGLVGGLIIFVLEY